MAHGITGGDARGCTNAEIHEGTYEPEAGAERHPSAGGEIRRCLGVCPVPLRRTARCQGEDCGNHR